VAGNSLRGSIPATVGGLTAMSRLDLSDNQLDGALPVGISLMAGLRCVVSLSRSFVFFMMVFSRLNPCFVVLTYALLVTLQLVKRVHQLPDVKHSTRGVTPHCTASAGH
jgi:hypothetical protein